MSLYNDLNTVLTPYANKIKQNESDISDLSNYTYSTDYINNFQQGYRHGRTNCALVVNSVWVISTEPITFRAGTTLKSIDPNTWVFSIVDPAPENNGQIIVKPRHDDYVFDTDTTGYVECRLRSSEDLTPEVANNDIVCGVYTPLIINKINALDKNINVINTVLTSNKNLWTADASLSFTKSKTVTLNPVLPAGTYTLSALVTSDDTDDTKCRFQINNSSTVQDLDRGTRANKSFTFASEITSVTFYAATNSTKSTGDSATWEDIQIETGSSATPYVAHKMTALDDTAREAVTRLSKYVSTTGSDNNDGNTPATAYATIEKALTECADTIYVAKGTYNENVITEKTWYRYRGLRLICDHAVMITTRGLAFRFCNLHISGLTVDLTDSESSTSYGFFALNCTGDFKDCEVIGATGAGGFRLDGSKMTLTRCKAHDCAIDGFNAHNVNTGYNSDCSFIDCEAYSNGDDGLSFHETSHIRVIGGRFYDNISTGIAPHQNCDFEIRNAYIYGNGTGIEAENPNYSSGDEKSEGLIIGCVISANNKTGRAQSDHIGYGVRAKQYIIMALANAVVDNDSGTYYQDSGGQITVLPIASA